MVLMWFFALAVGLLVVMRALLAGMDLRADLSASAQPAAGERRRLLPSVAAPRPATVGGLPATRHG